MSCKHCVLLLDGRFTYLPIKCPWPTTNNRTTSSHVKTILADILQNIHSKNLYLHYKIPEQLGLSLLNATYFFVTEICTTTHTHMQIKYQQHCKKNLECHQFLNWNINVSSVKDAARIQKIRNGVGARSAITTTRVFSVSDLEFRNCRTWAGRAMTILARKLHHAEQDIANSSGLQQSRMLGLQILTRMQKIPLSNFSCDGGPYFQVSP